MNTRPALRRPGVLLWACSGFPKWWWGQRVIDVKQVYLPSRACLREAGDRRGSAAALCHVL